MGSRIPKRSWFRSMNRFHVDRELNKHKEQVLSEIGKEKYDAFHIWCYKIMDFHGWLGIDEMISHYFKQDLDKGRVRLQETDNDLWKEMSKYIFKRDKYICSYCGKVGGKLEVDHIIPFSKGGNDSFENLTTSCRTCNRQKKDKSVKEFLEWRRYHE